MGWRSVVFKKHVRVKKKARFKKPKRKELTAKKVEGRVFAKTPKEVIAGQRTSSPYGDRPKKGYNPWR